MTPLPWPNKTVRDTFLQDTIDVIGRAVELHYVASVSGCPVCSLDPVGNVSTDAFCPTCSGFYWINLLDTYVASGHVTWKYSEDLSWYSAGKQFNGDCQVRLNYTTVLADIVDKTDYVLVDERVMKVNKIDLRGAPEINRIIITLQEKDKE